MSHERTPDMPKYGYEVDPQDHDIRRVRKARPCRGARHGRGGGPGTYSPDCTEMIGRGDIAVVTIVDLYVSERYCCMPCALADGVAKKCSTMLHNDVP